MAPVAARLVTVALLVGALLGLCVWLGALGPAPALGDYPGATDLAADYDGHVGERVELGGTVRSTDPVVIVPVTDTGEPLPLTVTDLAVEPAVGDHLRVFGVVEPGGRLRAIAAFAVPPWGTPYAHAISFLAGLWVLGRLLAGWRLDADWALARRAEPIPVRDALRRAWARGVTRA